MHFERKSWGFFSKKKNQVTCPIFRNEPSQLIVSKQLERIHLYANFGIDMVRRKCVNLEQIWALSQENLSSDFRQSQFQTVSSATETS